MRVAILSFAHYHANFWAEAFLAEPDVALTAIWDDIEARGRSAAQKFGVPFVASLHDAVDAADAVAICSENSRHAELVEIVASAGKPILCEKPIAATLEQADRIVDAVSASGVLFMQSFPKRLDPVSHELKQMVESGRLGRIHLVRIRHGHSYGLADDFRDRWYVDLDLGGGGALLDEGIHAADLLCWLFGMPATVVATTATFLPGLRVEDGGTALFSYANGMTAEITASFLFAAADTSIEVYGTRGTVLVSGVDLASRDIAEGSFMRSYDVAQGDMRWVTHDIVPRFKRGQFHHQNAIVFVQCVRGHRDLPATAEDGRNALLLIRRAYDAARTGIRQTV
ncbi:MAG: Gfo/Idh/MocA family protein [Propylenella sp.]